MDGARIFTDRSVTFNAVGDDLLILFRTGAIHWFPSMLASDSYIK
jgi:hypothetical protein